MMVSVVIMLAKQILIVSLMVIPNVLILNAEMNVMSIVIVITLVNTPSVELIYLIIQPITDAFQELVSITVIVQIQTLELQDVILVLIYVQRQIVQLILIV